MLNVTMYQYKEKLPEVGRHIYELKEEDAFAFTYFRRDMKKIDYHENYNTGLMELCADEDSITDINNDYWCYVDDVDSQLGEFFYKDWLWFVKNGDASLRRTNVEKHRKKVLVDYEFKFRGEVWNILCNGRLVFDVEKK